ncbi:MAG: MATE family efflux transporter, partial [Paracoccaceae bacterium]|nr:MATE family efflux transporter [Paracoccaceae bacterium]
LGAAWFGAPGVLIGQYVGGAVFALVALLLTRRVLSAQTKAQAEADPFARQSRLFSLLHHRR